MVDPNFDQKIGHRLNKSIDMYWIGVKYAHNFSRSWQGSTSKWLFQEWPDEVVTPPPCRPRASHSDVIIRRDVNIANCFGVLKN